MKELICQLNAFLQTHPSNYITEEIALDKSLINQRIFDEPIYAIGFAGDHLFDELRHKDVIHEEYLTPLMWNEEGESVLSFFLPFTAEIKESNRSHGTEPSTAWLHGRIEGQKMVRDFSGYVRRVLQDLGYSVVLPPEDKRFRFIEPRVPNWSERHTAFICGLGTFGLSKGIITSKGMAGRFGSVITSAKLPITVRDYSELYEYCIMCKRCEVNCPAGAIKYDGSMHKAKKHLPCSNFLDETRTTDAKGVMRYGCGKCQVKVPCESKIPRRR